MQTLVSKAEFSRLAGVSKARVSQFIRDGWLSDAALVMDGRAQRIDLAEAHRQLGDRVAFDQRLVVPAARARRGVSNATPGDGRGATLDDLAREKLTAARLANARARAEAAANAGRFVEADQARAELGRVAARLVSTIEGSLPELAEPIAALGSTSERDALHALRGAWRSIRTRLAGVENAAATAMPDLVEAA